MAFVVYHFAVYLLDYVHVVHAAMLYDDNNNNNKILYSLQKSRGG